MSTITIKSYSEEDAIRQAMLQFKKVTNIEKIKTGYKPNKTKVINKKTDGSKKWVTKFYLYNYDTKGITNDGNEVYTGMKLVGTVDTGKTEAIEKAKELAIDTQKPVTIRVVKVLESGSNIVGEVLPNGGIMGEWNVTGILRSQGILQKEDVEKAMKQNAAASAKEEEKDVPKESNGDSVKREQSA